MMNEITEPIPKKVFVSWKRKDILEKELKILKKGVQNIAKMNPDYEVIVYGDDDVEKYLINHLSKEDYENIKDRYIVEKVDLWRLMIIYYEGGIYTDIDRYYNKPFSVLIGEQTSLVLPTFKDVDFSHDIMMSAPNNPIYKEAIRLNLERRKNGCKDIYYLGAKTYMNAVVKIFCKKDISTHHMPREFLTKIREDIKKSKHFETFVENPSGLTTFFDSLADGVEHAEFHNTIYQKEKKELFNEYKLSRWGDHTNK